MTKIVCISDTHNREDLQDIPECDILLHAGDATMMGRPDEVSKFAHWFGNPRIKATHRVFVPGNHDWLFEKNPRAAADIMYQVAEEEITILDQESVELCGFNIYGEPRQPWFYDWAFNVERPDMKHVWKKVPADTDILVTHGPPSGFGDTTAVGDHVGCPHQTDLIMQAKLKLVVCGHIHPGYGRYKLNDTIIANASMCNRHYKPVNKPIVLEL